jgi:hypothetical protein
MTSFAENSVNFPDGQVNVQPPPDATLFSGFIPEQAGTRGQPLAAQWLNWLFRQLFRLANRDKVGDASGVGLFPYPNAMIRLDAVDMTDNTKFLVAVGYKGATGAHFLRVTASSGLALGSSTVDGNQAITGGTNIRCVGYNRMIGDI